MSFTPLGAGILASVLLHGMVESSTICWDHATNALIFGVRRRASWTGPPSLISEDRSPLKVEKDHYHPWAFQRDQNTAKSPPTLN